MKYYTIEATNKNTGNVVGRFFYNLAVPVIFEKYDEIKPEVHIEHFEKSVIRNLLRTSFEIDDANEVSLMLGESEMKDIRKCEKTPRQYKLIACIFCDDSE